jgi:UDP-N-acetylmuramate--alanine ligase
MSGLAEILLNLGHDVRGSDLSASAATERLAALGARVYVGHAAAHLGDADLVVVSSAVPPDNPEIVAARRRQVPVVPRAEMLAELMRLKDGIAVAGAHGKTTTSSMIAWVLEYGGLDPTAIIGGRVRVFGGPARLGRGRYLVAEADESDASFLRLAPAIAVITNVDREHLDFYGTFERLQDAFVDFAHRVPVGGVVVACADDPTLAGLVPRIARRVVTYGFGAEAADVQGFAAELAGFHARCRVRVRPAAADAPWSEATITLRVTGRHNLLNALAAVAVAREVGLSLEVAVAALATFEGVERRFQLKGEVGGVMVVDDYGHHPAEIEAVIAAARAGFGRRLLVVFQPHRYTRTSRLADELGAALSGADEVVLTEVYPAGEAPIPEATVDRVAAGFRRVSSRPLHIVKSLEEVAPAVAALARPGDLVITLGAGSIGTVADRILAELAARRREGVS